MKGLLEDNTETIEFLEQNIFPKIHNGNTILFLGAGFSVTDKKKYLGSEIISYYQEKLQVNLDTNDLVEFLDRASTLEKFNRYEFDQYIKSILVKIKPERFHKVIAGLDWRQIITTNLDLILENAYDDIKGTTEEHKEILPVRNINEYNLGVSNDQIKYVKLNGCISNISKYNFVFSSDDFTKSKKFYNTVLKNLNNLSTNVNFLSIGYSFTDGLAKQLLETMRKDNIQKEKVIYNVDPFPNESLIPFLESNNVITIKLTSSKFIEYYEKWESEKLDRIASKSATKFYNKDNIKITLDPKLQIRLNGKIKQLKSAIEDETIKPEDFYKGHSPNYSIILKDYDVIKSKVNKKITEQILVSNTNNGLIPINFLSGNYGIGKSTISYRVLKELTNDLDYLCIEIIDPSDIRTQDIEEIIKKSNAKNIVLLIDTIERNSTFKDFINFRIRLSEEQLPYNISFLAPIRENILKKYLVAYTYKNINVIEINHKLEDSEITTLIQKLKLYNLISVRDKNEEKRYFERIKFEFNSDPYVAMLSIVEGNKLEKIIDSVLNSIDVEAKTAFIFTSLLYQYKIPMPGSILKKLVSRSWDDFKKNVLDVDCKGLLINEIEKPFDTKEDLFFKTKHSIISEKCISISYKNNEKLFNDYLKIIRQFNPNDDHSRICVDLLKSLKVNNVFQNEKINKLYDEASLIFDTIQNFNIHYAINLESRKDKKSLEKAATKLQYIDSFYEKRNSHITHRRGSIEFNLARIYHKEKEFYLRNESLESARDFFEIKLSIDRFSSYSYYDYIKLELWTLQNVLVDEDEISKQHTIIQDLFIKAIQSVYENIDRILKLKESYIKDIKTNHITQVEIIKHFESLYENSETRPFALIFKLNTIENDYFNFGKNLLKGYSEFDIINELENYLHIDSVKETIFNFHSKRLYDLDSRMVINKYKNDTVIKKDLFNYHYTFFRKECYDYQFSHADQHLKEINKNFKFVNLTINELWIDDSDFTPKKFEGTVINIKGQLVFNVRMFGLSNRLRISKSEYLKVKKDTKYFANLTFTPKGISTINFEEIKD